MAEPDAPDPRRSVPRTDTVLADPRLQDAARSRRAAMSCARAVAAAQDRVRAGELAPADVVDAALAALPARATTLRPVLNATGVVLHTNLGRRPAQRCRPSRRWSPRPAPSTSSSTSATGRRGRAGAGAVDALLAAVPEAEDALVVNNGAAALVLATTALAAGGEVVVSRGEMVEIGDGFRLPDLITSCGARLREVGTTNRTHLRDYADAVGPDTGAVLKVHPSNFAVERLHERGAGRRARRAGRRPWCTTSAAACCGRTPLLPDEPDAATSLRAGAAVVTCSGDKLLGGPAGRAGARPARRRRAAAPAPPGPRPAPGQDDPGRARGDPARAAPAGPGRARRRAGRTARSAATRSPPPSPRRASRPRWCPRSGRVGGGSAPALSLEGWAVALPEACAALAAARRPRGAGAGRGAAAPCSTCAPSTHARMPSGGRRGGARRRPATPRRRRRADVAVVATAGHVDHGKSALVRALTGTDPDRLPEERRRGMTIELGHVWADVDGRRVAIVDVPGHDRLVGTTLAGLGPVAGVLLVVAADEGWRAQTEEHVAAVRALGLTDVALVVTRADLADPGPGHGRRAGAAGGARHPARWRWPRPRPAPAPGSTEVRAALAALADLAPAGDPRRPGAAVGRPLVHGHRRRHGRHRHPAHRLGRPAAAPSCSTASRCGCAACRCTASRSRRRPAPPGWPSTCARCRPTPSPAAARCSPPAGRRRPAWSTSCCTASADRMPSHATLHVGTTSAAVRVRPLGADARPAHASTTPRPRCRSSPATGSCCATPARTRCWPAPPCSTPSRRR